MPTHNKLLRFTKYFKLLPHKVDNYAKTLRKLCETQALGRSLEKKVRVITNGLYELKDLKIDRSLQGNLQEIETQILQAHWEARCKMHAIKYQEWSSQQGEDPDDVDNRLRRLLNENSPYIDPDLNPDITIIAPEMVHEFSYREIVSAQKTNSIYNLINNEDYRKLIAGDTDKYDELTLKCQELGIDTDHWFYKKAGVLAPLICLAVDKSKWDPKRVSEIATEMELNGLNFGAAVDEDLIEEAEKEMEEEEKGLYDMDLEEEFEDPELAAEIDAIIESELPEEIKKQREGLEEFMELIEKKSNEELKLYDAVDVSKSREIKAFKNWTEIYDFIIKKFREKSPEQLEEIEQSLEKIESDLETQMSEIAEDFENEIYFSENDYSPEYAERLKQCFKKKNPSLSDEELNKHLERIEILESENITPEGFEKLKEPLKPLIKDEDVANKIVKELVTLYKTIRKSDKQEVEDMKKDKVIDEVKSVLQSPYTPEIGEQIKKLFPSAERYEDVQDHIKHVDEIYEYEERKIQQLETEPIPEISPEVQELADLNKLDFEEMFEEDAEDDVEDEEDVEEDVEEDEFGISEQEAEALLEESLFQEQDTKKKTGKGDSIEDQYDAVADFEEQQEEMSTILEDVKQSKFDDLFTDYTEEEITSLVKRLEYDPRFDDIPEDLEAIDHWELLIDEKKIPTMD